MPRRSPSSISDAELSELALVITPEDMSKIAINSLGLEQEEVSQETKENQWKFNYSILKQWKTNQGRRATRQALAGKLNTAARKDDLVFDYNKLEDILGVQVASRTQNKDRKLTDSMIKKLSESITYPRELKVLALNGLGIESYVVAKDLSNHGDITKAAGSLLKEWCEKRQPSRQVAYSKLCDALRSVNMAFYVSDILEKD